MPLHETAGQAYVFLAFLYAGLLAGAAGDLLSPLTRRRQAAMRILGDLLLCLTAAGLCFAAAFFTRCGQLRLYMLIALIAGSLLYRAGLRRVLGWMGKIVFPNRKTRAGGE